MGYIARAGVPLKGSAGWAAHPPQIQSKNSTDAPVGLAAAAPQNGLTEPQGGQLGLEGHVAQYTHLGGGGPGRPGPFRMGVTAGEKETAQVCKGNHCCPHPCWRAPLTIQLHWPCSDAHVSTRAEAWETGEPGLKEPQHRGLHIPSAVCFSDVEGPSRRQGVIVTLSFVGTHGLWAQCLPGHMRR